MSFALLVFATSIGALQLFLYCYYGKYSTEYFAAFSDCLFESNWMALPNDLQRIFVVMLIHAQDPLYYYGYGNVKLTLETFLKVSWYWWSLTRNAYHFSSPFIFQTFRTVISYYLMFKTLTSEY